MCGGGGNLRQDSHHIWACRTGHWPLPGRTGLACPEKAPRACVPAVHDAQQLMPCKRHLFAEEELRCAFHGLVS